MTRLCSNWSLWRGLVLNKLNWTGLAKMSPTRNLVGKFPFQAYLRLTICFLLLPRVDMKSSKTTALRLCLILPENDPGAELQVTFETLLEDASNDAEFPVPLEAVTLVWGQNNRSLSELWSGIQNLLDLNVTAVVSFLPSSWNQLLLFLLSDASIPVIGLDSEDQWNTALDKRMYVSLRAPEALQASVIKELLLEYEQSRFVCITSNRAEGDMLWRQLFHYVRTSAEPRCIVIQEQRLAAIEEVYATLAAITASGIKVIVVHCTPQESKTIGFVAQKLNLKRLADDFVWIFSDQAKENNASEFPDGSIGISKLQWLGGAHNRHSEPERLMLQHLLRDSVLVFLKALATTMKSESAQELFVSFKRHLYREILKGCYDGETGPIEFNANGERTTYTFTISKVATSLGKSPHWDRIGSSTAKWDQRASPRLFETFLPRDLPQPRHLRIVTIEHEPFMMVRPAVLSSKMGASCPATSVLCVKFMNSTLLFHYTEPHSLLCCYGAVIDILLKMQQQTGFTFTLALVKDGKYGSYDPDERKMNGMIGDLVRGEADLAIGLITVTEERAKFVDFTIPYREVALAFFVKSNERRKYSFTESIGDMRLMKPFGMELWFACVATFFAVSLTVWLMEKFTSYRKVKSSYLLPFEFAAYVFGNIFHVPLTKISAKTFAVPAVMVIANCGALVLVSSYTANLLVTLIVFEETSTVSGVADIKLTSPPDGFTFGTVRDSSAEDFFKKSSNPRLRRIYDNMKNVDSYSEGIKKIQSGELIAFISESEPLETKEGSCQLKLDGNRFDLAGLAFALPKNSQWTSEFSRAIQTLNSRDGIDVIFKKWKRTGCESRDHPAAHAFSMGLDEFGGFLFNTFVICLACFFILLLEILVHKKISRNHQNFTFWKGTELDQISAWVTKSPVRGSTSTIILQ